MNKKGLNIRNIQIIIVFSMSILLYINTWDFGFASDDTMMITENKFTKGGFEGIKKIFTTDAFAGFLGEGKNLLSGGRYRPLSQLIFNIEYSAFGLNSFLWHFQNTLFFALAMVLVFITLANLFQIEKYTWSNLPFIASLIIVSHPLNTEVVANIKSFDLILALIFSVSALYFSLTYYKKPRTKLLIGLFISLFLGILSKETALTFLAIIPLSIIVFRPFDRAKFFIIFVTSLISISSYFVFRTLMIGIPHSVEITELLNNPFLAATTSEKYATIFYTWWHYLELYIIPINLTHDYYPYTISLKNWTDIFVLLSFIIYLSATIWSLTKIYKQFYRNQRPNIIAYAWLFYISIFSISSNLFVNIGSFMNERFIFIADIGLAIILSLFLLKLSSKINKANPNIVLIIILPIVLLFSIKTIIRNTAWRNDYTLFTTDVVLSNNSAKCNVSAGGKIYEKAKNELQQNKKAAMLNKAEKYLLKGIKIHPKYIAAYVLLGNVYFEKEEYTKSFQAYLQSIKLGERKDAPTNIRSLGIKLHQKKNYKSSLKVLEYYSSNFKTNSETQYYIADNYLNIGKTDTAIDILKKVINTDSTYDEAYNKLGEIYGRYLNQLSLSEYYLLKGYKTNPDNASICENLGVLNGIKGKPRKSIIYFERAIKNMQHPSRQIYQNLATSYSKLGDNKKAEEYLQKAKAVK